MKKNKETSIQTGSNESNVSVGSKPKDAFYTLKKAKYFYCSLNSLPDKALFEFKCVHVSFHCQPYGRAYYLCTF